MCFDYTCDFDGGILHSRQNFNRWSFLARSFFVSVKIAPTEFVPVRSSAGRSGGRSGEAGMEADQRARRAGQEKKLWGAGRGSTKDWTISSAEQPQLRPGISDILSIRKPWLSEAIPRARGPRNQTMSGETDKAQILEFWFLFCLLFDTFCTLDSVENAEMQTKWKVQIWKATTRWCAQLYEKLPILAAGLSLENHFPSC